MCGILGMVTWSAERDLEKLDVRALRNRGPDNVGRYVDGQVALYHTRLAVIDKKVASNQPLVSPCENYVLVCNGEIYNHEELRQRYPYPYQTTSDCETVLACYQAEGVQGFRALKGMFSFGLYDKKRGKLVVYRDAVGKKPLFTYRGQDAFLFSSSVTSIRDNLAAGLSIDQRAVSFYLKEGYIPPDLSFYEKVKPLLPGFLLEVDIPSGETTHQYRIPESTSYEGFDYTSENIFQEAHRLLKQSVRRRISGIENLVLLFSGGVDSTVLAKEMLTLSSKKPRCVSLSPLIPFSHDDFYGRYAARKLQVPHFHVRLPVRSLMEETEKIIDLVDQPLSLYSYYFLAYLTRKAREFGNVLFMGEGGDEVFYGYSDIRDWFSEEKSFSGDGGYEVGPRSSHPLSPWGRRQTTVDLLGHSFVKVDKATAEQQMEARCPYLDWDLMNFVRSVPKDFFLQSGQTKVILKRLLADFPAWFIQRKKIGFAFNFRYLMVPFYRQIYRRTDLKRLREIGVEVPQEPFAFKLMFHQFDRFWKLFVLSRVLSR